jgi:hypothetical protein
LATIVVVTDAATTDESKQQVNGAAPHVVVMFGAQAI